MSSKRPKTKGPVGGSGNLASPHAIKPGTRYACLNCAAPIDIHGQYASQPAGTALELWCRSCKVISVYYYMGGVVLLGKGGVLPSIPA